MTFSPMPVSITKEFNEFFSSHNNRLFQLELFGAFELMDGHLGELLYMLDMTY